MDSCIHFVRLSNVKNIGAIQQYKKKFHIEIAGAYN